MSESALPTTLGPYRILSRIGEGSMSTVFLAEQQEPVKRRVALKLIKLGMDSKSVVARLESERQSLAFMQHNGIDRAMPRQSTKWSFAVGRLPRAICEESGRGVNA